jgi:putative ABC transport system permease protein
MWNNKWLMLSLLVGNIFLIGIVSSAPMYSQATLQRIYIKNMEWQQYEQGRHPTIAEFGIDLNRVVPDFAPSMYLEARDVSLPAILEKLEVPPITVVEQIIMENWRFVPVIDREERPRLRTLHMHGYTDFEEHLTLLHGRMPSRDLVNGNIIECIVNQNVMVRNDLLLNEMMEVFYVNNEDARELYMVIVGVYEARVEDDPYWVVNPNRFNSVILVSPNLLVNDFLLTYEQGYRTSVTWHILLDYREMLVDRTPYYIQSSAELMAEHNDEYRVFSYRENYTETITGYRMQADRLNLTLWVLQAPIYILLAFYIFMVSKQILLLEQNDISVLKSRGASRAQLVGVYTMQSIFVAAASLSAGIPLGMFVCRILGASNGFLNLVQRAALDVQLNQDAILFSLLAAFLSILTMLLPVISFSRVTIVDHKRGKSGKRRAAFWQRFYLDFLCFGVASYAYYNFNNQREHMATNLREVPSVDPLIFLSSSLFIIGLGLICLRLFPIVVRCIFFLGRRFWSPSLYASLLKVIRSAGDEQFIMIFLVLTLAIGIFDAKAARTINLNNDHKIMYQAGADLIFTERWRNNQVPLPDPSPQQIVYYEPDLQRFMALPEVDSLTKVLDLTIQVQRNRMPQDNVRMMSIETHTFGPTVWYRDDLLPVHMNHFLNALASRHDAVLLSDNFRTRLDYEIGDAITYSFTDQNGNVHTARGVIHGFVSHWPGYTPVRRFMERSGELRVIDNYLLVSNLNYLQSTWGLIPYQVWMQTNVPSSRFFTEFRHQDNLRVVQFNDAKAAVVESKSDPILQGTNGILTVGFIVTLLICFTGFLDTVN